jgi:taurine--2-oxoglutarate transaminase
MTIARDLTSAYVQLGAVALRRKIADHFDENVCYGGFTSNSHTLACAAALATIAVYEEDGLIERAERMGDVMKGLMQGPRDTSSVGRRVAQHWPVWHFRARTQSQDESSRWHQFNGISTEMQALSRFFRDQGLYTFVKWNTFFPRLCISEAELRETFDVIDRGLAITDQAVVA